MVAFDKEKIGIVLENLIENAIKYTSPGGSITVKVFCKDNWVYVEVTDTGIGIPTEQIHYVFSKFFRAENAQLYQTSGTGIGLYLAKNIVEYHGGKISFRTKENKGSVFTFSLPMHKNNKKNT
jgi:signal transduction histidine kinase